MKKPLMIFKTHCMVYMDLAPSLEAINLITFSRNAILCRSVSLSLARTSFMSDMFCG